MLVCVWGRRGGGGGGGINWSLGAWDPRAFPLNETQESVDFTVVVFLVGCGGFFLNIRT